MAFPSKTDRKTVLAAAMQLLAQHGLRGFSLRSVAASLELAPNAIYTYFKSHEHLEAALGSEVSRILHAALLRASRGKSPEAALRAIARAYLTFAKKRQLLYEALLVPRPESGEDSIAPEQLWLFFVAQVSRLSGEQRAQQAAVALWAFLHGIATLQSAQLFSEEKPFTSFTYGLDAWISATTQPATK